jgi:phage-related protein
LAGAACSKSPMTSTAIPYRAVYTVKFAGVVYVLHAFQKKSKKGIATPQREIDLIKARVKRAEEHYRISYLKGIRS